MREPEPASKTLPSEEKGPSEENGVWCCNICESRFSDSQDLTSHSALLHAETHPAECRLCFGRFMNDTELGTHIKVKHIQGISLSSAVAASAVARNNNNNNSSLSTALADSVPHRGGRGDSKLAGAGSAHRKTTRRARGRTKSRKRKFINNNSVINSTISNSNSRSNIDCESSSNPAASSHTSPATLAENGSGAPKNRCKSELDFDSYYDWREHAVYQYQHIFTKNPYPIVEMNYVMVTLLNRQGSINPHSARGSSSNPIITDVALEDSVSGSNGHDGSGNGVKSQESLRLTICKNKGRNYMVKKSSVSDESEFTDENSNTSMTIVDLKSQSQPTSAAATTTTNITAVTAAGADHGNQSQITAVVVTITPTLVI